MAARDTTLDAMKGLGIIAVILGHLQPYGVQFIFSFHMPLFFISGGYLYKPKPVSQSVRNDAKRLLIPYCVTAVVVCFLIWKCYYFFSLSGLKTVAMGFVWANGSINHTSLYFSNVEMVGAIWFLFAMFWTRVIFNALYTKFNNSTVVGLCCIVLSAGAIILDRKVINLPFAILPGISALMFYWAGHKIKDIGGFKNVPKWIVGCGVILWICSFTTSNMSMVQCKYEMPVFNILGGIGASIIIYLIINKLKRGGYLSYLGSISILILCLHDIDLFNPIRYKMNCGFGFKALVWDMFFLFIGTIIISQIRIARTIFQIEKIKLTSSAGKLFNHG